MVDRISRERRKDPLRSVVKGAWLPEEDFILLRHISYHGPTKWGQLLANGHLNRSGKSCRLRYVNHLRPGISRNSDLRSSPFSEEEKDIILSVQKTFGNKWAFIADFLPGRTDNDVKNFWNLHLKRSKSKQRELENISVMLKRIDSSTLIQKILGICEGRKGREKNLKKKTPGIFLQNTRNNAAGAQTISGALPADSIASKVEIPSRKDIYPPVLMKSHLQNICKKVEMVQMNRSFNLRSNRERGMMDFGGLITYSC